MQQANAAISELQAVVDTLIVVSNDKLLQIVPENTPVTDAFLVADDILRQGVVGISEIIIKPGLINVDFADVRTIMGNAGTALMGVGTGRGKTRAQVSLLDFLPLQEIKYQYFLHYLYVYMHVIYVIVSRLALTKASSSPLASKDAAVAAISSPLLDFPIKRAKGIVFNVVGGQDLTLAEINAAAEVVYENADPDANIIFGALVDPRMENDVSITVLATGFTDVKGSASASSPNALFNSKAKVAGAGAEDTLDPDFYKARREATKSPLGADATPDDARNMITRGIDFVEKSRAAEQKKEGMMGGFFRKLRRRM